MGFFIKSPYNIVLIIDFSAFNISELCMAAFLSSSGVTLMFVKVSDKFGFFHAGIVNFR